MTASSAPETPSSRPARPSWLFWVALAAQTLLILGLPLQAAYTQATGRTVVLQTAPVDPYDLLRGYFVTLGYDISNLNTLQRLPGWDGVTASVQDLTQRRSLFRTQPPFYVILEAPANPTAEPPQPWKPVRVTRDRPQDLPDNQIALMGRMETWRIAYGLETYYIPEDQRHEINEAISRVQGSNGSEGFVVEVKVSPSGQAVPSSLWVAEQNYRF